MRVCPAEQIQMPSAPGGGARPAEVGAAVAPGPGRLGWIDAAKGLGIILVVFGHVWRGVERPLHVAPRHFDLVDSAVYSFHMPLFFFLAGLFVERSVQKSAARFVVDKLQSIAYPYAVWYAIQGSIALAFSSTANASVTPDYLVSRFPGGGYAQFWFLYTLFWIMMMFYGLRRLSLGRAPMLVASLVMYAASPSLSAVWYPLGSAGQNFMYVCLGAVLPMQRWIVGLRAAPPALLGTTAAVSGGLIVTAAPYHLHVYLFVAPVLAAIGITGTIAAALLAERSGACAWIRRLGSLTLPIYLAHIVFAAATRLFLERVLRVEDLWTHVILGCAIGLVGPVILALCSRQLGFYALFTIGTPQALRGSKSE
jgi:fucose 4-O-acetylase-like acetyltransferase